MYNIVFEAVFRIDTFQNEHRASTSMDILDGGHLISLLGLGNFRVDVGGEEAERLSIVEHYLVPKVDESVLGVRQRSLPSLTLYALVAVHQLSLALVAVCSFELLVAQVILTP